MSPTIIKVRRLIAAGIPKARIAQEAGLHENTLLHLDRESWSPAAATLAALEDTADRLLAIANGDE